MSQNLLVAQSGRQTGSASSRRLRAEGRIPAVIYGHGMAPLPVSVDRRELRLALATTGFNTLLSLQVDGKQYPAIIKDLQRHPIKRTVSHIDFLQVNVHEEITISVPVRLEGEAKAVLSEGGMVDPAVDSIEVVCTPSTMPSEIVIDVTDMQPGQVIRLAEVALPKGTSAAGDPEMPVVTAIHGITEAELQPAEEAVEGEGEGEAPAEGEAAAEGAPEAEESAE